MLQVAGFRLQGSGLVSGFAAGFAVAVCRVRVAWYGLQVSVLKLRVSWWCAGFAVVVGGFLVTGKPVLLLQYAGYWIQVAGCRVRGSFQVLLQVLLLLYAGYGLLGTGYGFRF